MDQDLVLCFLLTLFFFFFFFFVIFQKSPGELDPDPESKPARPDTIDLDEDEKEMLSEARARLANTQGKKAKRKARERQLEESRRLAVLQKRRELKNAGINVKVTTHRKGEMDYNADIPFEKPAAPGFYDTTEEQERNELQREMFDPRKQQLGGKRKGDQDEDTERKKRKNDKNNSGASAAAARAGQMQKIREAEQMSKRRPLVLPSPQVSDGEMEDIIKMGMAGDKAGRAVGDEELTRGLVGNYSNIVGGTPIRTPRAPPEEDRVANEIRNIRALTETQSSILGGENTPLLEGASSTGFEGIAPRSQPIITPNPMATPFRQANGVGGATPMRGGIGPGATPLRTPRDHFALNREVDGDKLVGSTPRDIRLHDNFVRQSIRGKLSSLPKPKETEWELEELPAYRSEPSATVETSEEDSAERDRREKQAREKAAQAELKRQTQVYQRSLPRPGVLDVNALVQRASQVADPILGAVSREAAILIAHDARKFPVPGSKVEGKAPKIGRLEDDLVAAARAAVAAEVASSESDKREWQEKFNDDSYTTNPNPLPGLVNYADDGEDPEQEEQRMIAVFDNVQAGLVTAAERGNRLEKKLALHYGGYQSRAKLLRNKIVEASSAVERTGSELDAFRGLQISEESAMLGRLERLRDEVTYVMRRERESQELYMSRKDELDDLVGRTEVSANGYH